MITVTVKVALPRPAKLNAGKVTTPPEKVPPLEED
jgi:hypothetical protein